MENDDIQKKIRALAINQPWNHSIELGNGNFTRDPNQTSPGENLIKWERIKGFLNAFSCKNQRILDLGSGDGFFSLKLAELGANVVALEANLSRLEKAKFVLENRQVSEKVKLITANIYDYPMNKLGYFDLVLCMGFLHRVPDPFTVISRLVPLSDLFLFEFKAFPEYAYDRPFMMFDGRQSDLNDPYSICYFVPSVRAIVNITKAIGLGYYGIIGNPRSRRVILIASKKNLALLKDLNTLEKVDKFYMVVKITKRFVVDILKTLKGDFANK